MLASGTKRHQHTLPVTVAVRPKDGLDLDEAEIELDSFRTSALREKISEVFGVVLSKFSLWFGVKDNDEFRMYILSAFPDNKLKKVLEMVEDPLLDIRFEFAQVHQFKAKYGSDTLVLQVTTPTVLEVKKEIQRNFSELQDFDLHYRRDNDPVKLYEETSDEELADLFNRAVQTDSSPLTLYVVSKKASSATEVERDDPPKAAPSDVKVVVQDTMPEAEFDSMLSYSWKTKSQVQLLKANLEKELKIKIWMDENNMKNDIYSGMWEGIAKSQLIIVCLSKEYLGSENCKKELKFAADLHKPIVCVYMFEEDENTEPYKYDQTYGPTFLIVSGLLYVEFRRSEPPSEKWQKAFHQLKTQIESQLRIGPPAKIITETPLARWLKPVDFSREARFYKEQYVQGTRKWISVPLRMWLDSDDRVHWLCGAAGTGKSIIAWLVAEQKEIQLPEYTVGSVFYCRHNDEHKRNPARIVSTMVWDLSKLFPSVRKVADQVMAQDEQDVRSGLGSVLDRPIEAFKTIIVEGLKQVPVEDSKPVVLVVDALDECDPASRAKLLRILTQTSALLPPFVKIFTTGRPDEDIWEELSTVNPMILKPTDEDNLRDLAIFSRACVAKMLRWGDESLMDGNALARACVDRLVEKSEGLFIYARAVFSFLGSDTSDGLRDAASLLQRIELFESGPDNVYKLVMTRITQESSDLTGVRRVLETVLAAREPVTIQTLASLGDMSVADTGFAISKLRPILNIDDGLVSILHKSLKDFLVNAERSGERLHFDQFECDLRIAKQCLHILNTKLHYNMAGLEASAPYTPAKRVLPDDVAYAASYWARHYVDAHRKHELLDDPANFVRDKTRKLDGSDAASRDAAANVGTAVTASGERGGSDGEAAAQTVRALLHDVRNIAINFLIPLQHNPLQVYATVGVWAKKRCEFFRRFGGGDGNGGGAAGGRAPFRFVVGHEREWGPLTFLGHAGPVRCASFSRDGRMVASASDDGTVKVWSVDGFCLATVEGHRAGVSAVAFLADDKSVVSGSRDGTVRVWRALDGSCVKAADVGFEVLSLALTERYVIVAGTQGGLKALSLSSLETACAFVGHGEDVTSVAASSDGSLFASASTDCTVKIWKVGQETPVYSLEDSAAVNSVAFYPDRSILATGNSAGAAKLWNLEDATCTATFTYEGDSVTAVTITRDGKSLVLTDVGGRVKVIDLSTRICKNFHYHSYPNYHIAIGYSASSTTGEAIAISNSDNVLNLLPWNTPVPSNSIDDAILGNDIAEGTGHVEAWSLQDGRRITDGSTGAQFSAVEGVKASGDVTLSKDSWILDGHGQKLMWVPVFANGEAAYKQNVLVLTKGSRISLSRKSLQGYP
ncbi:hypothetical protein DFJ73DRAFT_963069 [Zopfochytrium polystomum]|nr:hypothetical protein DFJ73DRAFT_963069 [Zopfochytrium polystomum]